MSESKLDLVAAVSPPSGAFHVGDWLAEPAWNRIRRNGEVIKLEPRVMRVLEALAASQGSPLMRQGLLDTVWPDVHVNEDALSRAISQLRRALGDDPKAPRYIETVHKGGYCLIAPVTISTSDEGGLAEARPKPSLFSRYSSVIIALVLAVVIIIVQYGFNSTHRTKAVRTLVPLTSEPGREIDPAISPDGRRVAYLASSSAGYDLFVRNIDSGSFVRLTEDALAKGHPTWSPVGDRIAFVAAKADAAAIFTVPSKGGPAEKLIDLSSWSFGLDWSPDGRTLAFSDAPSGGSASIALLDVITKSTRRITHSDSADDVRPVFSPDGLRLAFIRRTPLIEHEQIVAVDLAHADKEDLHVNYPQQLRGMDWTPDGRALIFSARSGRKFRLWRVVAHQGAEPEILLTDGGNLFNPSVSSDGRVVVEEVEQDTDIWLTDIGHGGAGPVIRSTSDDYDPAYAPEGRGLAFVSERSGTPEIWIQAQDGDARRLTTFAGPDMGKITWSGDGLGIAFLTEEESGAAIYTVKASGGEPQLVFSAKQAHVPIGWSEQGDALFILSPIGEYWRLQELTLADQKVRSIGVSNLRLATLSADRRSIFALSAEENALLRISADKGVLQTFRLPESVAHLVTLFATDDAVYLIESALGSTLVHRLDLASGAVRSFVHLEDYSGGAVSMDRDNTRLAYPRGRETANDLAWTRL